MVETDAGLILRATVRAGGPGDGDRVVVVVRPERTRLVSATEGIVSGRLIEATYLGETTELRVDAGPHGTVVVRRQNGDPTSTGDAPGLVVGEEVGVRWDDGAALALPESSA